MCRLTNALSRTRLALPALLLLLALLSAATLSAWPTAAQDKGKPVRPDEEEDDAPPPAKPTVPDAGDTPKDTKPEPVPADEVDLKQAARAAKHPAIKELFEDLMIPRDEVKWRAFAKVKGGDLAGKTTAVKPIADYVPDLKTLKKALTFQLIDGKTGKAILGMDDKTPREATGTAGTILRLTYYEDLTIERVKDFLDARLHKLDSSNVKYLTRYNQLLAAEQTLAAVVRFHNSARELGTRKGEAWDGPLNKLRGQLFEVLLEQLTTLADGKRWDDAFKLARRLAETYRKPAEHAKIAAPLADLLKQAIKNEALTDNEKRQSRKRLRQLEDQFPNSKLLAPLSATLREEAKNYFDQAKKKNETAKTDEEKKAVIDLLQKAEDIWPDLDGLRKFRVEVDKSYRILRVGVRELPKYMSPALAFTNAERWAVELMFESLVQLTPDAKGNLSYRPMLAESRPRIASLGREFKLPRNGKWSDGRPLTVGDLRGSLALLLRGKGTGRPAAWGELLDRVQVAGDPYRAKILLKRGFIDPLGPMSFKIVPIRGNLDPDGADYALNPVPSSGPFCYGGKGSEQAREYVAFKANEHYAARGHTTGQPRIKEVRFFASADPVKDLQEKKLDMVLDLTAEQAGKLEKVEGVVVPKPSSEVPNRRIHFLAINHTNRKLRNPAIRLALAWAINRDKLLSDHFRNGWDQRIHRVINGPYPAGTWACDPTVVGRSKADKLDLFDEQGAKSKWKQGLKEIDETTVRLELAYPSGDDDLAAAMKALCKQASGTLPGLTLVPKELTPEGLRRLVEEERGYHLAYYQYDFPDESLWLKPLLGGRGRGGKENYLGYTGSLVGKVLSLTTVRSFKEVQTKARQLHFQFVDAEMPFIPLWQLQPLWAYRKANINPGTVDPRRMFGEAGLWKVTRSE